jgi:hypothetical protein
MNGIEGSKRDAANMMRSLVSTLNPAHSIAALVSRAG